MKSTESLEWLRRFEQLLLSNKEYARQQALYGLGSVASVESDDNQIDWMTRFFSSVYGGVYPDPVDLLRVASGLNRYVAAAGTLTLDKAFGLKSARKGGSPARQRSARQKKDEYLFAMARYRASKPRATLAKAAEHVHKSFALGDADHEFSDSMVRYYSDEKWRVVESLLRSGKRSPTEK